MRRYELTILIRSDVKDEAREKFLGKIEKLVKTVEGRVDKVVEMGQRQLAYKISNQVEAQYISWTLELPAAAVVELGKKLNVDKEILRYLLVVGEEKSEIVKRVAKRK